MPVAVDPYPTRVLPCLTNRRGRRQGGARHLDQSLPFGLGAQVIDLARATQQNSRALDGPACFQLVGQVLDTHRRPFRAGRGPAEPLVPLRSSVRMITSQEHEVADVAQYMGYELICRREGYVLVREYRNQTEEVRAPTLELITKYIAH